MRSPKSVKSLEALGRVRLSPNFYLRDFLYSEVANMHGIANIPEDPDLAIAAGGKLCTELLEPLAAAFGGISVRSGYRSPTLNAFCCANGYNCGANERNRANHIWDLRDAEGGMGATACVVVRRFADLYAEGTDWRAMAWWIHDHLPYGKLMFFPKLAAFNIQWHERPERTIYSYVKPKGWLTKPGMANHDGDHSAYYADLS